MATYAGGTRECARTTIAILLLGLVCAAPVQHQSASRAASSYSTDFSSYDSSNWSLENGCEHCDGHTGDECTAMTPDAVQFGQPGANIRTSRGGSCGSSSCTSGHLEWTQSVTFGVFKVRAKWFAGSSSDVNMASGFIGLFGGGDSITFIFHGAGWNDGSGADFRNTFQSEVYKSGQNHNKVNTGTGADFQGENDFELDWRPDSVTWRVNGQTVRTFNDRSKIPQGSMAVRLHSRAGYCSKMTDTAFHVHLLSFSYSPASIATEATIMPSIPPPNSDRCASHFDLSSWELDLPVSSGGGMKIIKQPQLISYSSDYFKMVSGACEFWAPINGGTSLVFASADGLCRWCIFSRRWSTIRVAAKYRVWLQRPTHHEPCYIRLTSSSRFKEGCRRPNQRDFARARWYQRYGGRQLQRLWQLSHHSIDSIH